MFSIKTAVSRTSLQSVRAFSTSSVRQADFSHAVVGGGVVGLAIARKLQSHDAPTVLIERHGHVGTETSSRNSEVIHAGLYYGENTLKTKLCLRGKQLMYELCQSQSIPHANTGKWIVAQDDDQMEACKKVHAFAQSVGVPTHWVSKEEGKRREPDVRAEAGILESPSTGIVDSHSLMQFLQGDFENLGGICAFKTAVTRVEPIDNGAGGWKIWSTAPDTGEETSITADTIINSAGLGAISVSNMILPSERHRIPYYAKGSYFSYSPSQPRPKILVYPAPTPGKGGLGTHLTIDIGGRIRFGPDVEWVEDPTNLRVNDARLPEALSDIRSYLPSIDENGIGLDYAGMRPKLQKTGSVTSGKGFQDFHIQKEDGFTGFVNLLGIESPGLTSSLAIAEEVEKLLY